MPRPTIDLLICDIDGTLITSNHELTPATKRVALELRLSGIHLCLVSSRPPRSIKPIARELGVRAPFAAFNGALIQLPDDQILAQSVVPSTLAQRIRAMVGQIGLDVWLYNQQDWWVATRTPFVDREAQTAGFLPRSEGFPAQLKREHNKLTVVGTPDVVLRAEERMRGELGGVVSTWRPKPRFLDVTAVGWNKSMVLKRLAALLNLTPEQIAVIGDGPGDAVLFKQAGLSIAMGQAVDSVKNQATHVTTSNDDEGWARGVEQFILKGRPK